MDITGTIKAIITLDADGKRLATRYFDEKASTRQFEKKLFVRTKSSRIKDDILMLDGFLILHRFITDVHIYIVGRKSDNPLILDSVLRCFAETVTTLLIKNVERQAFLNHLSEIILAIDEICDNGMIIETDPNLVLQRISLKDDLSEQTMAQKLQSATEQFRFPWSRS